MEYYSALKRKEVLAQAATRMNLEGAVISEVDHKIDPTDVTYLVGIKWCLIVVRGYILDLWSKKPFLQTDVPRRRQPQSSGKGTFWKRE